jgi:L-ascorbate metabolism protein UlaG (beta-lactamase superfamily)
MLYFLVVIILFLLVVFAFLQQTKFGKHPSGERLNRIKQSPNYKNGSFQNLSHTPDLTEGTSYYTVGKEFFFDKKPRIRPIDTIPSLQTDLLNLDPNKDVLVWFGHSSYFMQVDGKRILVDPVLSGFASPIPSGTKAFKGTNNYSVKDIPEIDFLFLSHDHWDHLDYETVKLLQPKIKKVICGLGTGAHLEFWGYDKVRIIEKDWNEQIVLEDHFIVNTVPARHFSGRGIKRNQALWISFVLQTPTMKLFVGGDSGYDTHFAEIGKKFGPFDLAILENGQYDKKWRYIHLMPDEILTAAKELKANRILPVHSAKFVLGNHPWDEPLELITRNNETAKLNIITPMIGEVVYLKDKAQVFTSWWRGVN